jgi:NDP-sugar pyrophosphorylase family protein
MRDVRVGSNCFVKNSIIGQGSVIENNFSTRDGMATIEIEGEYNKLKNIGAMIGEDCKIGSHVVVEPGMIIGRKCKIWPMKRIANNIVSNSVVM